MGPLLFGTSFRAAMNLIIKWNGVKSKAMWIRPDDFTNQMQLLSAVVTTGLETIYILTRNHLYFNHFLKVIRTNNRKGNSTFTVNVQIFQCFQITHYSALTWYKPVKEKVFLYFK